jgi:hypothetical protein
MEDMEKVNGGQSSTYFGFRKHDEKKKEDQNQNGTNTTITGPDIIAGL